MSTAPYLPFGVYPRPSSKKGTQGVCVAHRAVICALIGFRRQRKEQGNNAEVSVLFTAVFIFHPRTPLQCCNLHFGSTTSIWCRPCVKQYRQYFSWLRSRYGGRSVFLPPPERFLRRVLFRGRIVCAFLLWHDLLDRCHRKVHRRISCRQVIQLCLRRHPLTRAKEIIVCMT